MKHKKTAELVPQFQEIIAVATTSPSIKERYGALLVAEKHSVCPNDGCNTTLFVNAGAQLGANYEVTFIDPSVSETRMKKFNCTLPGLLLKVHHRKNR